MIKVTYRRTSRLSIRIGKKGDVLVSAPLGLPREVVQKYINENEKWIEEARQRTYEQERRRADFYNRLPLRTRQQADEAL